MGAVQLLGMARILVLFRPVPVATGLLGVDDVTATAIYGLYRRRLFRPLRALGCGATVGRAAPFFGEGCHCGGPLTLASFELTFYCPQPIVIGTGR